MIPEQNSPYTFLPESKLPIIHTLDFDQPVVIPQSKVEKKLPIIHTIDFDKLPKAKVGPRVVKDVTPLSIGLNQIPIGPKDVVPKRKNVHPVLPRAKPHAGVAQNPKPNKGTRLCDTPGGDLNDIVLDKADEVHATFEKKIEELKKPPKVRHKHPKPEKEKTFLQSMWKSEKVLTVVFAVMALLSLAAFVGCIIAIPITGGGSMITFGMSASALALLFSGSLGIYFNNKSKIEEIL